MTLTQLKEDSKYLRLTDKQKIFVYAFCESNGDKLKAAHAAYDCKDDDSAKAMAYSALRNPSIRALCTQFVEVVSERITKEEMLDKLGGQFRRCSDDEVILKYASMIAKLEGWETKPAPANPEPPSKTDLEKISELEK